MRKEFAILLGVALLGIGIAMAHGFAGASVIGDQASVDDGSGQIGMAGMMDRGAMGMNMQGMAEMYEKMEALHDKFSRGEITREQFIEEMAKEMEEHWDEMPCHRMFG